MRHPILFGLSLVFSAGLLAGAGAQDASLQQRFDAQLSSKDQTDWLKLTSAEPNQVGSPHDRDNAEFMLGLFRSWGYDAQIESFDVLFPTPKVRVLELTAPEHYAARLSEPTLKGAALKSSARSFARVVTVAPMRRATCTSGMVSSTAA